MFCEKMKAEKAKSKNGKTKSNYVMICPKCKSTDITSDREMDTFGIMPIRYVCKKCGYSGNVFPEVEIKKEKIN